MKKCLVVILVILLTGGASFAQRGGRMMEGEQGMERIHAAKVAYITDRLHLTSMQMTNFLPLYSEYETEIKGIRQPFRQKYRKDYPGADAATIMQYVMDDLDFQEQTLAVKRKYQDRFLKIISQQQYTDLGIAEREFKQILMRRVKRNEGGGRFR